MANRCIDSPGSGSATLWSHVISMTTLYLYIFVIFFVSLEGDGYYLIDVPIDPAL